MKLHDKEIITVKKPINNDEAESFFSDGYQYKTNGAIRISYNFCTILGIGGIYKGICFIKDSAPGLVFSSKFDLKFLLKKFVKDKFIFRLKGKYLAIQDEWTSNHYHFHIDFLPRIILLSKEECKHITLILPDTNYMRTVGTVLIKRLGYNFKETLFLLTNQNLFVVSNVIYITKSHPSGLVEPKLTRKIRDLILSSIIKHQTNIPSKKHELRIYAKRGKKYGRVVLNEKEITTLLTQKYKFEVIDFDEIKLDDAIALMKNTKILIGMHGAALTNSLYMPEGGHLLEFRYNGKHNNHCYWHLASAVGLEYGAIFGISDDETKILEGNGCNLTVEVSSITKTLDKIIP